MNIETNLKAIEQIVETKTAIDAQENRAHLNATLNHVLNFINKNNLMVYGGTALNQILPTKYKFYSKDDVPDYDCFTPKAKEMSIKLANELHRLGYKYVHVKRAVHDGTYKVYTEFTPIIDITQIPKNLYERMLALSKKDYNLQSLPFIPAPYYYLKFSLHHELAKPISSLSRWTKVYQRLVRIDEKITNRMMKHIHFDHNRVNLSAKDSPVIRQAIDTAYDFAKKEYVVVGGKYAAFRYLKKSKEYAKYSWFHKSVPYCEIFSENAEEDTKALVKKLQQVNNDASVSFSSPPVKVIAYFNEFMHVKTELVPQQYDIKLKIGKQSHLICTIFSLTKECLSYNRLKNEEVDLVSIDTLFRIIFASVIANKAFENDMYLGLAKELIENYLQKDRKRLPAQKRLSTRCIGTEMTLQDIRAENWKKHVKPIVYIPE
jgi:hypothetical protein